jgi:hypothetical protein
VSLKLLDALGLIEVEAGPRLVNVFRFSNRWRTVDAVEAVRLAALARELKPHRTFERAKTVEETSTVSREPKPVKSESKTFQFGTERPRDMQRRVPSLPTMPWHDDGR